MRVCFVLLKMVKFFSDGGCMCMDISDGGQGVL